MVCPYCNAEIKNGDTCEYCGRKISYDMKREQEFLNKSGCPKCGSSNIVFSREKQGEIKGKNGTNIVRNTVGMCKDCGHTWITDKVDNSIPKKRKTWLWVLGWIFFFPIPLTILVVKNTKLKPLAKGIIIAIMWALIIIIGNSDNNSDNETSDVTAETVTEMSAEMSTTPNNSEVSEEIVKYHYNETVNQILIDYNAISEYTFTPDEVKEGGYDSAAINKYNTRMEVHSTNKSDKGYDTQVVIELSGDTNEMDVSYYIFRDFVKTLRGNLSDDSIEEAWNELLTEQYEYYSEHYELDGLEMSYGIIKYNNGNSSYDVKIMYSDYVIE